MRPLRFEVNTSLGVRISAFVRSSFYETISTPRTMSATSVIGFRWGWKRCPGRPYHDGAFAYLRLPLLILEGDRSTSARKIVSQEGLQYSPVPAVVAISGLDYLNKLKDLRRVQHTSLMLGTWECRSCRLFRHLWARQAIYAARIKPEPNSPA